MTVDILMRLDRERRAAGEPSPRGGVVREPSPDGAECRIVYSSCTAEEIQGVIRDEIARAESGDYTLEWKVYGHDGPRNLGACLLAAGFEAEPLESVLVSPANAEALAAFDAPAY